jgi:hypothetical protein
MNKTDEIDQIHGTVSFRNGKEISMFPPLFINHRYAQELYVLRAIGCCDQLEREKERASPRARGLALSYPIIL